jgi:hypothetical protein
VPWKHQARLQRSAIPVAVREKRARKGGGSCWAPWRAGSRTGTSRRLSSRTGQGLLPHFHREGHAAVPDRLGERRPAGVPGGEREEPGAAGGPPLEGRNHLFKFGPGGVWLAQLRQGLAKRGVEGPKKDWCVPPFEGPLLQCNRRCPLTANKKGTAGAHPPRVIGGASDVGQNRLTMLGRGASGPAGLTPAYTRPVRPGNLVL